MKKQLLSYVLAILCINTFFINRVNASCGIPSGPSVGAVGTTSVIFDWMPVQGATSYYVQYRKAGIAMWQSGITNITSFTVTGLTTGTMYEWQVQAICQAGLSPFSDYYKFITQSQPLAATAGMSINSLTFSSASVSWTPVQNACSYHLQYKTTASGSWTTVTGIYSTSFNLTGLSYCTSYQFRVRAFCANATSSYGSAMTFNTTGCPVPNPNTPSSNRMANNENENVKPIALYPNPVRDHLKIEYISANNGLVKATIYNMIGKNIMTEKVAVEAGMNFLNMTTSELPAGIYFFEIENNGEQLRSKFMISR